MKIEMKRSYLVQALSVMNEVATKGIKSDFDLAGRVTIKPQADKVEFLASNGHLNARWSVSDVDVAAGLKTEKSDPVTVNIGVAKAMAASISSNGDHIIELSLDGDTLYMKNLNAKKRKSQLKMQTIAQGHDFSIAKPRKGFSCQIPAGDFKNAVSAVGKYQSKMGFKVRYQMICLHFFENETRFVCGDGMRFGILSKELENKQSQEEGGEKYLLPVDQASIISNIASGDDLVLTYTDETTCHINTHSPLELLLVGIPNEKYISYENHAYKMDQAKAIADVPRKQFVEALAALGSCRDKESEAEGDFLSCRFSASSEGLDLRVHEGKYQGQAFCDEVDYYDLQSCEAFNSEYAHMYLDEAAAAWEGEFIRFYCIDESKVIIARPVDLDDSQKDDNGTPVIKPNSKGDLTMFFASVDTKKG